MALSHDTTTRYPGTDITGFSTTAETIGGSITASSSASAAVAVVFTAGTSNLVSGITYGGSTMTLSVSATDSTEAGRVDVYTLTGSNFPSGTQTFSLTRTGTTQLWCLVSTITTALGHITSVDNTGTLSTQSGSNPSINVVTSVTTRIYGGLHGGAADPASYASGANYTAQGTGDYGAKSSKAQRSTNELSSGTNAFNFTYATTDDWGAAAVGIAESPNVTLTPTVISSVSAVPTVTLSATLEVSAIGSASAVSTNTVFVTHPAVVVSSVGAISNVTGTVNMPGSVIESVTAVPTDYVVSSVVTGLDFISSLSSVESTTPAVLSVPDVIDYLVTVEECTIQSGFEPPYRPYGITTLAMVMG